jgi:NAD(P)-dependent dehydrogenase (short-subunit alcohol dehydrogenase family)
MLRSGLDTLYDEFNAAHAAADPVWFAHRFPAGDDREVVAFISAALAFGRVQSVLNSIEGMLAVMGPSPAAFVREFKPARDRKRFDHLVHRWTNGPDFAALVWILHQMIEQNGSIENFFAEGLPEDAVDISAGLQSFSTRALAMEYGPQGIRANSVAPGVVETVMWKENLAKPGVTEAVLDLIPTRRLSTPQEVADVVAFLASDASRAITGEVIAADGGMRSTINLWPKV